MKAMPGGDMQRETGVSRREGFTVSSPALSLRTGMSIDLGIRKSLMNLVRGI